jgi:hypothetical protein
VAARKTFLILAMASALALVAAAPVWAQDPGSVNATIPFSFNVGAKALPAGNYELRRLNAGSVVIRNVSTRDCAMALVMYEAPKTAASEGELVFHQYGDSHFLSEVWTRDVRRGLPMSKLERRAASRASEIASNSPASRTVYIAARAQ